MSGDLDKSRKELSALTADAKQEARRLETLGNQIVERAREIGDIIGPMDSAIQQLPDGALQPLDPQLDLYARGLKTWCGIAKQVKLETPFPYSFNIACSSITNTTNTAMTYFADNYHHAGISKARDRLILAQESHHKADAARRSLQRLDIDTQFIDDADGAWKRPVAADGGAASILIPVRGCIDAVIDDLRMRRPVVSNVKGGRVEKVEAIASQCARTGVEQSQVDALAASVEPLMNELSGVGKDTGISREKISELLVRGLAFIVALADIIDETKLSPPKK